MHMTDSQQEQQLRQTITRISTRTRFCLGVEEVVKLLARRAQRVEERARELLYKDLRRAFNLETPDRMMTCVSMIACQHISM